jgi:hypothetical protein
MSKISGDSLKVQGDEPLVLTGPPHKLKGKYTVSYSGEERVRLQNTQIRNLKQKGSRAKTSLAFEQKMRPLVLRPGRSRRVPLSLAMDRHTPPGEYQAELTIGDQAQAVKLFVAENIDLAVSPRRLVLPNVAGSTAVRRVVFTNQGNVPLIIGEIGAVPLDDNLLVCRTLRAALKAIEDEAKDKEKPKSFDEYMAEIFHQAQVVLANAGILRVHNKAGIVTLAPGAIQAIDLEIRLPDTLDRRTRYSASAAIYTSSLSFIIVPTTEPGKK